MNPFLLLFLAGFIALLLRQILLNRRPTYCGTATVVSRRVEPGRALHNRSSSGFRHTLSTFNYIVTFRLSDGEELELTTDETAYSILEEGLTGQLHWQGTDFRYFESND